MDFCISSFELRKALETIEAAEKNGFDYCLAVFQMSSAGPMLDQCRATFSDLIEKADPTDPNLDWGRFQGVSRRNKFVDGELVPIKQ